MREVPALLEITPPHISPGGELHQLYEVHTALGLQDWFGPLHHYECSLCQLSLPNTYKFKG